MCTPGCPLRGAPLEVAVAGRITRNQIRTLSKAKPLPSLVRNGFVVALLALDTQKTVYRVLTRRMYALPQTYSKLSLTYHPALGNYKPTAPSLACHSKGDSLLALCWASPQRRLDAVTSVLSSTADTSEGL